MVQRNSAYNCDTASIAEIDPSVLSTDELGELEDEVNLSELSNKRWESEKEYATLSEFIFNNIVEKGFYLITIKKVDNLIVQVNEYMGVSGIEAYFETIQEELFDNVDFVMFIRNFDQEGDN